jgi:hypothetical protein
MLTKKDIRDASPATLREWMANPEMARQLEALGIPVLKGSWQDIQAKSAKK